MKSIMSRLFLSESAKKNENNFFKLTNPDTLRAANGPTNNPRREALSLFFDCNGGYGRPTAERVNQDEFTKRIWILPMAPGTVAISENTWFLNDSASRLTKFLAVRKCSSVVAAMQASRVFIPS